MHEFNFQWGGFLIFALINSFTPGPNVILLAGSGSAWGFKKTLPHLLGICLGFPIMLLLVIYGSDQIFKSFPWIYKCLTFLSLLYVGLLSFRIFKMGFAQNFNFNSQSRPMSFLEASLFQWINGKAWQIAMMAATLYPTMSHIWRLSEALLMACSLFFCGMFWIELGKRMARILNNSRIRILYYSILAVSLLGSTWPKGLLLLFE